VIGLYCHNCGQENIEPKESVWHLVTHFFQDITHFDGKFFTSMKLLILKPGFLSREYMLGRRASYLNPVRMYLFTSAIFFLIFFSLYKVDEKSLSVNPSAMGINYNELDKIDSVKLDRLTRKFNDGKPMTREEVRKKMNANTFSLSPSTYKSKKEYDSLLKAGVKKHNWIERQFVYKDIALKEKYNSDGKKIIAALLNSFMHTIPQMLFILLPLFALILKLVYIRRKQFYYVDHIIFTIHIYILVFLVMLVTFGISKLRTLLHWDFLNFIEAIFVLAAFFYFYKALRNFYKQRRAKTILKYFILLISFLVTTVMMFIVFFLFSVLTL
jgi:hypothetical protein